jgi:hypothetical protein
MEFSDEREKMACPIGVEPTTFSFGGNSAGSEVSTKNCSRQSENTEEMIKKLLSLIVNQCRELGVVVDEQCYNHATYVEGNSSDE